MRHLDSRKRLNRDKDHRKALLLNLSQELIKRESIQTTLPKAKYLRPHIERLITKAKNSLGTDKISVFNTVKNLRTYLNSEIEIKKLMTEIAPRYKDVPGGYTKITRTGIRGGDAATLARIELVNKKVKKENKKNE